MSSRHLLPADWEERGPIAPSRLAYCSWCRVDRVSLDSVEFAAGTLGSPDAVHFGSTIGTYHFTAIQQHQGGSSSGVAPSAIVCLLNILNPVIRPKTGTAALRKITSQPSLVSIAPPTRRLAIQSETAAAGCSASSGRVADVTSTSTTIVKAVAPDRGGRGFVRRSFAGLSHANRRSIAGPCFAFRVLISGQSEPKL